MGWLAMNIFDRSAVSQVRVARPTDRLDEIETFYQEAIGLPRITFWWDGIDGNHAGYDGLILGMPDGRYHLEFTHYRDGTPCPAPSRDNLLVFYLPDATGLDRGVARMKAYGHDEVEPENPWWRRDGGMGTYSRTPTDGGSCSCMDMVWGRHPHPNPTPWLTISCMASRDPASYRTR